MALSEYLDRYHLELHASPPDGHCFLHSVVTAFNYQLPQRKSIDLTYLLSAFEQQALEQHGVYSQFLDSTDAFLKGLFLYTEKRIYNQAFGDLVPLITSNALKTNIFIFNEVSDIIEEQLISCDSLTGDTIYVHRANDHYSGLIPAHPRPSADPGPAVTQISYTKDQLTAIRDGLHHNVPRSTRKRLFRLHLWRPRTTQLKEDHSPSFTHKNRAPRKDVLNSNVRSQKLKVGLLNPRSSNKKGESICDFIVSQNLDICAITETWLCDNSPSSLGVITPNGYASHHVPRSNRKGGGVAIVYRQSMKCNIVNTQTFSQLLNYLSFI